MKKCGIRARWFTFSASRRAWGDPSDTFWFDGEVKETSYGKMFVIYNPQRHVYLIHPRWITGLGKVVV